MVEVDAEAAPSLSSDPYHFLCLFYFVMDGLFTKHVATCFEGLYSWLVMVAGIFEATSCHAYHLWRKCFEHFLGIEKPGYTEPLAGGLGTFFNYVTNADKLRKIVFLIDSCV
jgi:hypothetical protein